MILEKKQHCLEEHKTSEFDILDCHLGYLNKGIKKYFVCSDLNNLN